MHTQIEANEVIDAWVTCRVHQPKRELIQLIKSTCILAYFAGDYIKKCQDRTTDFVKSTLLLAFESVIEQLQCWTGYVSSYRFKRDQYSCRSLVFNAFEGKSKVHLNNSSLARVRECLLYSFHDSRTSKVSVITTLLRARVAGVFEVNFSFDRAVRTVKIYL